MKAWFCPRCGGFTARPDVDKAPVCKAHPGGVALVEYDPVEHLTIDRRRTASPVEADSVNSGWDQQGDIEEWKNDMNRDRDNVMTGDEKVAAGTILILGCFAFGVAILLVVLK